MYDDFDLMYLHTVQHVNTDNEQDWQETAWNSGENRGGFGGGNHEGFVGSNHRATGHDGHNKEIYGGADVGRGGASVYGGAKVSGPSGSASVEGRVDSKGNVAVGAVGKLDF